MRTKVLDLKKTQSKGETGSHQQPQNVKDSAKAHIKLVGVVKGRAVPPKRPEGG